MKASARVKRKTKPEPLSVPDYFQEALRTHARAKKTFDSFSSSKQKEYVEWVTEATRRQRLATALEWLAEGKSRNCKYQPK